MSPVAWAVIFLLIVINAFYVAAEFAAVGVRRSRIQQLAENGNLLAQRLLPILEDTHKLDRYVAACQIGITLSSLILGAYGQATLGRDLAALLESLAGLAPVTAQSTAILTVLMLLTALQVVFGELVPKSLALQYPAPLALYTYLPMHWSLALYAWFIDMLNGSGNLILKLLGIAQTGGHRHIHSPDEIEMLIAESKDGGLLEPEEQDRLHRALHLERLTARQLMVPRRRVAAVDIEATPEEVLETTIESPYTRLPVYRDTIDNLVGMLHTKDLAAHYARHGSIAPLQDLLYPITAVPSEMTADRLLSVLRERRSRLAIVVDEFGGMEGIVTLEDVLAELVGDVADEFKNEPLAPERLPDGRVRLPGALRLDEVERWIGVSWEAEKADTVGGRVLAALDTIPQGGERVVIDGVEAEVERMEGLAVASVLVTPMPAEPGLDESEA